MKRFFALMFLFVVVVSSMLTGCTGSLEENTPVTKPETTASADGETQPTNTIANETTVAAEAKMSVEDCLTALANSETSDEIKKYLTENTYSRAEALVTAYPGTDYEATAEIVGDYGDYQVYKYELVTSSNSEFFEKGMILCEETSDGYLICANTDVINEFSNSCSCHTCGGSGSVYSVNTCAICGGTGQQYIPNAYYDAALNMWQGLYQACSGCAGAGKTGGTNITCWNCGGVGFVLN